MLCRAYSANLIFHIFNPCDAEFISGHIQINLHFLKFPHAKIFQVAEHIPRGKGARLSYITINMFADAWRHKEPGYQ